MWLSSSICVRDGSLQYILPERKAIISWINHSPIVTSPIHNTYMGINLIPNHSFSRVRKEIEEEQEEYFAA